MKRLAGKERLLLTVQCGLVIVLWPAQRMGTVEGLNYSKGQQLRLELFVVGEPRQPES